MKALLPDNPSTHAAQAASTPQAVPPVADAENAALPGPEQSRNDSGKIRAEKIPLEKLRANPDQPRKDFRQEDLEELAASIREHGIIEPLIVEDSGDGNFVIVAGERRARAGRIAGLAEAPAIIRNYSEETRMAVALIENVQRADLNPIEEAAAYKRLMELTGLSQDETAARVGKNRSTVANALRLLKLPLPMQDSLRKGELSAGHARAILSVHNEKAQGALFREILEKGLSVREAEKFASHTEKAPKKNAKDDSRQKDRPADLAAMEDKFLERLGTRVKINGTLSRGTIIIDYFSMEDLDRLYGLLAP
jgi:ParB family chromosome partitioning protein